MSEPRAALDLLGDLHHAFGAECRGHDCGCGALAQDGRFCNFHTAWFALKSQLGAVAAGAGDPPREVCDPYGNPLRALTEAEQHDERIRAAASRHDDVHPCATFGDDLLVAREMLAAADRVGAGDRPPAPSEPNAVQLEAVAQTLWEEFGDGDVAWDNATASDREGFRRCAGYAIGAYKRAVRPTPRAAPTEWRNGGLDRFETNGEWKWCIDDAEGHLVLEVPTGQVEQAQAEADERSKAIVARVLAAGAASPAAAPPQEER